MVELVLIMFLSLAARDEAALRYDDSVQRYIEAVHSGAEDLQKRRDEMGALHVALRAILERERMREIDLALDVRTLRDSGTPETDAELRARDEALRVLRFEREQFLARRTVIEREQQAAIASALVTSPHRRLFGRSSLDLGPWTLDLGPWTLEVKDRVTGVLWASDQGPRSKVQGPMKDRTGSLSARMLRKTPVQSWRVLSPARHA